MYNTREDGAERDQQLPLPWYGVHALPYMAIGGTEFTVFAIFLINLNQILCCDIRWNRLVETIPTNGHSIGIGWEMNKLAFDDNSIEYVALCIYCVLFISYKFVKGFLAITFLLLFIFSWNFHDVCQLFLYNQEQNFSLIRQKTNIFPIDPHYKNRPLL